MKWLSEFVRSFTPYSLFVFLCALAAFGVVIGLVMTSGHG